MANKEKNKDPLACRLGKVGGQAVIEGVMMRGKTSMATAVRDADGIIRIETKRLKPRSKGRRFLRLPIIRGVVSFFSSLVMGSKVLMRSAEVYGESEPSKFEKWCDEKLISLTKSSIYTSFGFDPVVSYYYRKNMEIKTVRMILTALKSNTDKNIIYERVRKFYA